MESGRGSSECRRDSKPDRMTGGFKDSDLILWRGDLRWERQAALNIALHSALEAKKAVASSASRCLRSSSPEPALTEQQIDAQRLHRGLLTEAEFDHCF
jgi:hypothetical protein